MKHERNLKGERFSIAGFEDGVYYTESNVGSCLGDERQPVKKQGFQFCNLKELNFCNCLNESAILGSDEKAASDIFLSTCESLRRKPSHAVHKPLTRRTESLEMCCSILLCLYISIKYCKIKRKKF